jgi:TPR repeat protein
MRRWAVVTAGIWCMAQAMAGSVEDYQRGREAYRRGDVVASMAALRPAAAAGHAAAQSLLGYIYDHSGFIEESVVLWQKAAAQGDAEAHVGLGNAYLTGRGVAKDEKLALRHFSKAAAAGHDASVEVVATAWIKGQMGANATAEPALAMAAVRRAAEKGHLPSMDALALAYRDGQFGVVPDAVQAAAWQTRATALRQQRAAALAPGANASGPAR